MFSHQDTIAALATPLGEGGVGVIRVSGRDASNIVSKMFRKAVIPADRKPGSIMMDPPLTSAGDDDFFKSIPSHTCHLGMLGDIDQVVVTLFRAPHSYTGEDVVEISAHGSPFTLQKILNLCLEKGARLAGPGEFTQRAFLNGKMDLTQAEAVSELIRAKADRTQAAALAQMQGHLARKVRSLRDSLLPLLAHIEVGLDHSDEDHDFLSRADLTARCGNVQNEIEALLQSAQVGKTLREGLRVVILGRPNVGKSSLLNALLKEERAIVTATPGTTRDTLEESVNMNGIPVVLTDTAGLRLDPQEPIERMGMDRTRRCLEQADVILGLFDGSEAFSAEDEHIILQSLAKPHIWVVNKSDLPQRFAVETLQSFNGKAPVVTLSAKTGEGLESLIQQVTRLDMVEKSMSAEAQWLLNTRHQAALVRAKDALALATQAAQGENYEECVALELQTALGALGEIIGETTTEDLLDQIFSQFCIGK
jgi:tRNA modification GTPase